MAELLILEFDGVSESEYRNVNAELGIDPETGKGDWPAGLITHLAGLAVVEACAADCGHRQLPGGTYGLLR